MDVDELKLSDYLSGRAEPDRLLLRGNLPDDVVDQVAFRHGVQRGYLLALVHVRQQARGGTPLGNLEEYALQQLPTWIDQGGLDNLPEPE